MTASGRPSERLLFAPPYQMKKILRLIRMSRISDGNFRCWAGVCPVIGLLPGKCVM